MGAVGRAPHLSNVVSNSEEPEVRGGIQDTVSVTISAPREWKVGGHLEGCDHTE